MTQIPGQPMHPPYGMVQPMAPPPSWSVTSIAGFVLSFLGCTLIGGLLGILLGIVGILDCRGGRRRGMGLAIAAIPISMLSGGFGIMMGASMYMFYNMMEAVPAKVQDVFRQGDIGERVREFRALSTGGFQSAVNEDQLASWFKTVEEKQGQLQDCQINPTQPVSPGPVGATVLNFNCNFVNGKAPVSITLLIEGWNAFKIDDIEVDALSPRDSSQ